MTGGWRRRVTRTLAFAMAVATVGWGGVAVAGKWRIVPSFSFEEAVDDNVRAAPRGQEEADIVSRGSSGLSIRGQGGGVSLNLDYSLNRLNYLDNTDLNEFRQSLAAQGSAELIRDRLVIEGQGSIAQQFVNPQAAVTGSQINGNSNLTTVQTYNLTPVYRQHFGRWADLEARVRLTQTFGGSGGGQSLADSTAEAGTVTVNAGRAFTNLTWGLTLAQDRTSDSGGGSTVDSYRGTLDLQYRFSPSYAVIGTLGTETINDNSLNNPPSGLFWTAGLQLDPGPRTSLRVTYGNRFDTNDLQFDLTYRVGAKTTLTASYTETIQRSSQQLANQLSDLTVDPNGNLIVASTGLPFVPGDPNFGVSNNAFRERNFTMSLAGSRGRSSFTAQTFVQNRKTDATGGDETVIGGSASLSRALTRKASASVNLSFTNTDFGTADGRKDNLFTASLSYSYLLVGGLSASLSYTFSNRASTVDVNELRENVATLRVTKSF